MNQWKQNKTLRYRLGLGVLLCVAVLVISTGTTYARYRKERTAVIAFQVREQSKVNLGIMEAEDPPETGIETRMATQAETKLFQPKRTLQWETVNGTPRMVLAVANGTSDSDFSTKNQRVYLRLVGSLGLWTGEAPAKVYLSSQSQTDPEQMETLQGVATPIVEGTQLYYTYGPGWVYTFYITEGEEMSWELPGGKLNHIELTLSMENALMEESAMLQPQVITEAIR